MLKKQRVSIVLEPGACCPEYKTAGSSGADLRANIKSPVAIAPGGRASITTGITCEVEGGYELQIRPRSGLAINHGITVVNSPGTIDSDYRGPIEVLLINLGDSEFLVTPGMRIAQLVCSPVVRMEYHGCKFEEMGATERGIGGFGHTGTS